MYNISVLGKRLGKSMGMVSKEVKAMSQEDVLSFEKSGEITVGTHCLKLSDIKVSLSLSLESYAPQGHNCTALSFGYIFHRIIRFLLEKVVYGCVICVYIKRLLQLLLELLSAMIYKESSCHFYDSCRKNQFLVLYLK